MLHRNSYSNRIRSENKLEINIESTLIWKYEKKPQNKTVHADLLFFIFLIKKYSFGMNSIKVHSLNIKIFI